MLPEDVNMKLISEECRTKAVNGKWYYHLGWKMLYSAKSLRMKKSFILKMKNQYYAKIRMESE